MATTQGHGGALAPKGPVHKSPAILLILALIALPVIAGLTVRYFESRDGSGGDSGSAAPAPRSSTETYAPEATPEATPESTPTETRDYSGQSLRSERFINEDLAGVSFAGADLRDATFRGSLLTGANFDGADLTDAKFVRAEANGASFRGAKLSGTRFTYAYIRNIDLQDAKIDHVDFSRASTPMSVETVAEAFSAHGAALGRALYVDRVRVDDPSDYYRKLAAVCRGAGSLPEAAAYDSSASFSPMVMTFLGEGPWNWGNHETKTWKPMSMRYLQLIACVKDMQPVRVASCGTYSGGGTTHELWRGQDRVRLSIVAARTGQVLSTQEVRGSLPEICPYTVSFWDNWTITGEDPPFGAAKGVLADYVGTPPR